MSDSVRFRRAVVATAALGRRDAAEAAASTTSCASRCVMREIARRTDEAARVTGFFFAFSFFAICSVPLDEETVQTLGALSCRRHAPDHASSIVGNEQRSIGEKKQSRRTTVDASAV